MAFGFQRTLMSLDSKINLKIQIDFVLKCINELKQNGIVQFND